MDIKEQIPQLIKEVERLWKQLTGLDVPEAFIRNPMTTEEVQKVESELNVILPQEYKEFLQSYGSFFIPGGEIVYGKNRGKTSPFEEGDFSVVENTVKLREKFPELPKNFIPILDEPDCGAVCLICGGPNHGKLVLWVYYRAYKDPEFECQKEGPDFWTWFYNELLSSKKEFEEELAKPINERGIKPLI